MAVEPTNTADGKSKWPLSHKILLMVFWVLLWGDYKEAATVREIVDERIGLDLKGEGRAIA